MVNLASDNTEIIESTPETTLSVRHPYISSLFQDRFVLGLLCILGIFRLKIAMFMSRLIPKTPRIMNHEAYNIQSISDCFVLDRSVSDAPLAFSD